MRILLACAVGLLLAGCDATSVPQTSFLSDSSAGASARPSLILVTDFTVSSEILMIDRGFTARLERKVPLMNFERKQRTVERVNDEIVATVVAALRDAGLDAEPGSEEGLSLSKASAVIRGSLRPTDPAAKKDEAGIGDRQAGKMGSVTADVTLSGMSGFGKKQLYAFSIEPAGGKTPASGKAATAANASVASVLVALKSAPEKLSPEVEATARKFGHAIADKVLTYAKGQGWLDQPRAAPSAEKPAAKPEASPAPARTSEAAPEATSGGEPDEAAAAQPDETQMTRLPPAKPAKKPAA